MAALLLANRNQLRLPLLSGGLAYASTECDVGWDGQPHPSAGQVYVAVHPGRVSGRFVEGRADEFTFTVTLSMRLGQAPVDRWGADNMALASTGLYARADAIAAMLHRNLAVFAAANTIIGPSANGFAECQRFQGMGPPMRKEPDWWWAEDQANYPNPPVGLAIEMQFGDCWRFQTYESQT